MREGMHREEVKSRMRLRARQFNAILDQALQEGSVFQTHNAVHLPDHTVDFTPDQKRRIESLMGAFEKNRYTPPSTSQAEEIVGPEVLAALVEQGRIVKLSESVVFDAETYHEIVQRILGRLEQGESMTVARVRDMFATSRKYALALLEHMDERRLTRRVGDERFLR
jgi:selenocysteine-specific elongation factor